MGAFESSSKILLRTPQTLKSFYWMKFIDRMKENIFVSLKTLKHSGENSTENFEKPNYFLMSTSKTTKQRPGDTNKGRKVSWKLTKFSILIHFECLCLLFVCGEMTHSSLNSTALSQKKLSNRLLLLLLLLSLFSLMIIQRVPSRFSHKKIEARNH